MDRGFEVLRLQFINVDEYIGKSYSFRRYDATLGGGKRIRGVAKPIRSTTPKEAR